MDRIANTIDHTEAIIGVVADVSGVTVAVHLDAYLMWAIVAVVGTHFTVTTIRLIAKFARSRNARKPVPGPIDITHARID